MASLVLGAAGAALGGSLFGSGFSILGATLTGAQIGGALGAVAGSVVDSALFASRSKVKGARSDVSITASTEGAVIPRLYGRQRVSGQLIWATRFKEKEKKETTGGKGGGVTTTTYTYSISVAVALCEGPISRIDRIWADGNEMDLEDVTYRIYLGSEDQAADPLVAEMEGADNAPAFRGTAYIVFEHLALADFGNRIPQFQFEVIRAIGAEHPGTLETMARAVTLIPGAGEFVYGTTAVTRTVDGNSDTENKINPTDETDIVFALDQLHAILPNVETVALVVGWFGTDLRAGSCRIVPGVEVAGKSTSPYAWSVAGVGRAEAHVVSHDDEDNPLYGGTPADRAVTEALAELKRRGLKVIFYPFVFMDIRDGNGLPDPYGEAEQKPFPWRGRITADIAPGLSGSADKTSAISADIDAFFDGEWGLKRFIRHYADLCTDAGGVDAFLIGSEMVGVTTLRDGASSYPAVAKLRELAADVRGIVGADTKIGYGADWSEYFGHHPADGSGDVFFHLDPLWADDNIDFVGIDNYMPLADWRDGED
ncbi:GTA TIM-barrel-like domain-containing protein, partial [Faunimonas pinastri]